MKMDSQLILESDLDFNMDTYFGIYFRVMSAAVIL